MSQQIEDAIEKVRAVAARDAWRSDTVLKVAFLYNLILFPVAVALLTGNYAAIVAVSGWVFWLPMGLIMTVALILGAAQLLGPGGAARIYFDAHEIYNHAKDLHDDRERILQVAKAATLSNSILLSWISSIPGYVIAKITQIPQMEEAATEIVEPLVEYRKDLFGIYEADELWNFAVYLYDRNDRQLFSVCRIKHLDHPASDKGRAFRPGQGHVGKAFADKVTKITADASSPDVRNLMDAAPELVKPYDTDVYRSYASVPIGADQLDGYPFGVIVATSNRVGRFNLDNANILRLAASVLANVIELNHYEFRNSLNGPSLAPSKA